MSDMMRRAFKASRAMEPIAVLDDYVKIITYKDIEYRQVTFYESIPPFQAVDLGAIAAQTVSARTNVGNLDLNDDEFGQWRYFPLDNCMLRLFLPRGVSKNQLKFLQIGVEKNIISRDPTLVSTEIFSWEDERPAMEGMNFSDYALAGCRVVFMGYRFHTREVKDMVLVSDPGETQMVRGSVVSTPDFNKINTQATQKGFRSATGQDVLKLLMAGALPCTPIQCAGMA